MLQRAFATGLRPAFVLADAIYGSDHKFKRFLEERALAYIVAASIQQRLWAGFEQRHVDSIAER